MRKRKLYFPELSNIAPYYQTKRMRAENSPVGVSGWLYYVDALDDVQRSRLGEYNNVYICTIIPKNCPEMVKKAVFLGDKCF